MVKIEAIQKKITEVAISDLSFHPDNALVFKPKGGEFVQMLARDIDLHGLNEPIEINEKFVVLSGENRVRAFQVLGRESIPARIVNVSNELEYLISRNVGRRQITYSDRVLIYQKIFPNVFTMRRITSQEIEQLSNSLMIPKKTIESDFTKIRNGKSNDITIEKLRERWKQKNHRDIKINAIDTGSSYLIRIESRSKSYEFGPGQFKGVLKEAFEAAEDPIFNTTSTEKTSLNYQIRELRTEAGLTQFQMAQKLGYSQSYIAEFENGRWKVPQALYDRVLEICLGDK